ncbi:Major facilitator superfamily domain, general substrate transporter [Penicillium griseofulvum]|uniref:Major facilitator superfamily domain, general substrate transporter n=1 Tax=Penicillium patulum TaxID=5078 RepID=A0A135LC68_PENPA|nr:Major facilitator superfamily domain, general substrate transporter [Penicillium griseofulvum]KXG46470.1 Major facilitator superfamily domain, general substrate transporter [Penicillium griseofulvum]
MYCTSENPSLTENKEANEQSLIPVTWVSDEDSENPYNWSATRKVAVTTLICIYTFTVYCGSSIYVPSEEQVMEEFGVSEVVASLGLALYVLGYGMGPLLFSPLSEIPHIGRNPVYISTFAIFIILSAIAGGFFGSPCLATGAASLSDMFSVIYMPYTLVGWSGAMYCGPALGPLLSGFSVSVKGEVASWRWSMWEIVWLAGFVFVLLVLFLPETSTPTLLFYKAKRLRQETGSDRFVTMDSMRSKGTSRSQLVKLALIKPFEITLKDPAIAFTDLYTSLTYGIYYSFFEVIPMVYPKEYGFNLGETSAVFVSVLIACIIGAVWYCIWYRVFVQRRFQRLGTFDVQETFLRPGLVGVLGVPLGMFLFGWAARASVPWPVPTLGVVLFCGCSFVVGLGIFIHLPLSYPEYAASLFAANDALRSAFAAGAVLFGRPLYLNLGVGKGCTLLGGLSIPLVIGFWYLFMYGDKLRKKSKFTVHA